MINKKLLFLFLGIFLLSFGSASLGTFQKDTCVDLRTISNSTQVNISSVSLPNNTVLYINTYMNDTGKTWKYTFCATDTNGQYIYDYFDKEGNVFVNDFTITYAGDELTNAKAILNSVFLLILVIFWFLVFFYANKLPSKNIPNEEGVIQVSKLKYLRESLFGVLYFLSAIMLFMASNVALAYLPFEMFGKFLFVLFQVMMLLSIPMIIVWGLWLLYSLTNDKQIARYLKMGMSLGGKGV